MGFDQKRRRERSRLVFYVEVAEEGDQLAFIFAGREGVDALVDCRRMWPFDFA